MDKRKTKRLEEIEILTNKLQRNGIEIRSVIVFGSFLHDDVYNDIDVALISDNFSGTRFLDMELIIKALTRYSTDIDFHPFNTNDFYNDDNFFASEIIKNGKNIIDLINIEV